MRSYGQYCGLARSLEMIGDRWNLLIVRELLVSPARYRDLQRGLHGIATNLLADRLRDLEAAGVLERRLSDNGQVVEYTLTPWGAQLREPIQGLIRWSLPLMIRGPEGDEFRPAWLSLVLPTLLAPRVPEPETSAIGLDIGEELLRLVSGPAGYEVTPRGEDPVDATVQADAHGLLGLASGALSLDDALALGLVRIDGDVSVVRTAFAA
ncbi:MAG: winged helix-turn-helix transcriptional regulator [Aeromicrobium sp.]|uniref:winged helix-turn-helix transcriptional regulator n=1 Tax=Aeromicrobium sp. TaxID=1871063 RepID=UPI0039E51B75